MSPYRRIMQCAQRGTGCRLSAKEVAVLARDHAIYGAVDAEDEEESDAEAKPETWKPTRDVAWFLRRIAPVGRDEGICLTDVLSEIGWSGGSTQRFRERLINELPVRPQQVLTFKLRPQPSGRYATFVRRCDPQFEAFYNQHLGAILEAAK